LRRFDGSDQLSAAAVSSRNQVLAELQLMSYLYRTFTKPRQLVAGRPGRIPMKQLRASRQLIKVWHRREKSTIDHLVRSIGAMPQEAAGTMHSAFTASGLAVEDQVRKAWRPYAIGLAMF
jgi:hypothetical protein